MEDYQKILIMLDVLAITTIILLSPALVINKYLYFICCGLFFIACFGVAMEATIYIHDYFVLKRFYKNDPDTWNYIKDNNLFDKYIINYYEAKREEKNNEK